MGGWNDMKPFVDPIFAEIDRPDERLVSVSVDVFGDGSDEPMAAFARGLTAEQQKHLLRHVAALVLELSEADRIDELFRAFGEGEPEG